jgi:phage tail-like protein
MPNSLSSTVGVFRFFVEVDNQAAGFFEECNLSGWETEVIEYREGGDNNSVRKLVGVTRYPNIILKRGVIFEGSLWDWAYEVAQGRISRQTRRSGAVVMCADDGAETVRFTFERGWPCRWEGPILKASESAIAVEVLEIAHEGITKRELTGKKG